MIESHDYHVELTGTGLKTGSMESPGDALPTLEVASPPEFGGPPAVWSPEHLYVAALSSCLMTTFRSVAQASGLDVLDYSDKATGRLRRGEDRMYSIERVTLRPRVVLADESRRDLAIRLLTKAEKACLISRSVLSEVVLEPTVEIARGAEHSSTGR